MSRTWDGGMRDVDADLYAVVLTLLCAAGRHRMARVYRLADGVAVPAAGEMLLHGKTTGRWFDGTGHEIRRWRGADLVVEDDGVTRFKLNAHCHACAGRENPQITWPNITRLLDVAAQAEQRHVSVALTALGSSRCQRSKHRQARCWAGRGPRA